MRKAGIRVYEGNAKVKEPQNVLKSVKDSDCLPDWYNHRCFHAPSQLCKKIKGIIALKAALCTKHK